MRKGESASFAKRSATLHFDVYSLTEPYSFRIEEDGGGLAGTQDFMTLMQKMQDPKLTSTQRDQLLRDLEKLQQQMQANAAKMTDPANIKKIEEERQNFGCQGIYADVNAALAVKGRMRCSQKVGTLNLAGTVRLVGR